jgi:uncharacterized repeat protein (TIGR01451 family)
LDLAKYGILSLEKFVPHQRGGPADPVDDVTDDDTNAQNVPQSPALSVDKVLTNNAGEDLSGDVSLDDTLTYQITAFNDGNVTLNNVVVSDDLIGTTNALYLPV